MPRLIDPDTGASLVAYVKACQFTSAQDVHIGYRECAELMGLPPKTVHRNLSRFTERKIIDVEAFISHMKDQRVDCRVEQDVQDRLVAAILAWRDARALTHVGCRIQKRSPKSGKKIRAEGTALKLRARHLLSPPKQSRRPR